MPPSSGTSRLASYTAQPAAPGSPALTQQRPKRTTMRARTNRVYHLTVVMLRRVSALLLLCALPAVAFAQKPATADRVRSAADEYDAGRRAFNDSKFDEAAVHFENAFRDA